MTSSVWSSLTHDQLKTEDRSASSTWTRETCNFNASLRAKNLPQYWQAKGLIPWCMLMCLSSLCFQEVVRVKCLPHATHLCSRSSHDRSSCVPLVFSCNTVGKLQSLVIFEFASGIPFSLSTTCKTKESIRHIFIMDYRFFHYIVVSIVFTINWPFVRAGNASGITWIMSCDKLLGPP